MADLTSGQLTSPEVNQQVGKVAGKPAAQPNIQLPDPKKVDCETRLSRCTFVLLQVP